MGVEDATPRPVYLKLKIIGSYLNPHHQFVEYFFDHMAGKLMDKN
jgi:hypothetical protein